MGPSLGLSLKPSFFSIPLVWASSGQQSAVHDTQEEGDIFIGLLLKKKSKGLLRAAERCAQYASVKGHYTWLALQTKRK
eukprot:755416-Pelagomonas_calceolata.AAC.3